MNRRRVLFASGVTVSAVLAGCAGDSDVTDEAGSGNDGDAESGNGDENGGDGESPDEDDPQPDETTDEDGGENADDDQPAPQTLFGSRSAVESVPIEGGLTVVESEHHGSDSFSVRFRDDDGASAIFADDVGAYEGAKANGLEAGTYTVEVEADGDWRLEVRQPRATDGEADALPRSLGGDAPDVVGPIAFDGDHTVAGEHDGEGYFQVRVFPEDGTDPEMVILENGAYEGEETFSFDGVGWIDVDAGGSWALEID